jgi:hypothetical protein
MKNFVLISTLALLIAALGGCTQQNKGSQTVTVSKHNCISLQHGDMIVYIDTTTSQITFVGQMDYQYFICKKENFSLECNCEVEDGIFFYSKEGLVLNSFYPPCAVTQDPQIDEIIKKIRPCENPNAIEFLKKHNVKYDVFGNDLTDFLK